MSFHFLLFVIFLEVGDQIIVYDLRVNEKYSAASAAIADCSTITSTMIKVQHVSFYVYWIIIIIMFCKLVLWFCIFVEYFKSCG